MSYTAQTLCAALVFLFASCSQKKVSHAELADADTLLLRYAKGFQIIRTPDSTRITVFNPWAKGEVFAQYTLHSSQQSLESITDQRIQSAPVRLGTFSSTVNGYLTLLGAQNLIAGASDGDLICDSALYRKYISGELPNLGKRSVDSYESIIDADLDAMVKSGFEQSPSQDTRYLKAGIPVLYINDWTETHPLARAEWIKFIACFAGKSEEADSLFSEIETRYLTAKEQASKYELPPTVLVGGEYNGSWYVPGGKSYFAQFLADAHARYPWSADNSVGSITLSLEEVFDRGSDAKIWLSTQDLTPNQLVERDERLHYFKSVSSGQLYTYNKRIGAGGGNDYWESGSCRPDLILQDIITIIHQKATRDNLYYFTQLRDTAEQISSAQ